MSKLREFLSIYRLYRRGAHGRLYCAKMAFNMAYRGWLF